ncbi:hypothetical protein O3P69_010712 [Scylla paramamosain]|uniref:Secreted protein n=1 Tax=Scylla paramamosain TaxID=85552 RepID=A0AAW0TID9_SCYPA
MIPARHHLIASRAALVTCGGGNDGVFPSGHVGSQGGRGHGTTSRSSSHRIRSSEFNPGYLCACAVSGNSVAASWLRSAVVEALVCMFPFTDKR